MKKNLGVFLIAALSLISAEFIPAGQSQAAASNWQQKGVSIRSNWSGDFGSTAFEQSVNNAALDNINYIALVLPYYQSNLYSTDIQAGGDTPTDAALSSAINYIHGKGLHVMLVPHLESYTGEWRADINPSDRITWFTNYTSELSHLAQLGQSLGVEDFCLGTELIDMSTASSNSTNTQNWLNLIAKIRKIYSGKLTYGANWGSPGTFVDEANNIQFWNSLDYIGISAYFELGSDNQIQNLESAWNYWNTSDIEPLSQHWNKPVVFTEVGYKSASNAHTQPWNYNISQNYDAQEQVNDYQALFDYWGKQSFLQGLEIWDWNSNPAYGGAGNADYTPQHKPAEQTMQTWFGSTQAPPPTGNPVFTINNSDNPATGPTGHAVDIATIISNGGQTASGINVDVEIYNSAGQQALQKTYTAQNFAANQSQTYHTSFTISSGGPYTVKIGVFNFSWSTLYIWNNDAGQINSSGGTTSGNPPPPPPPPSGSSIVYVNAYPTVNGNYIDCDGTIDNDMAHHTTNPNDTDSAHRLGQNCPAGSYVATH